MVSILRRLLSVLSLLFLVQAVAWAAPIKPGPPEVLPSVMELRIAFPDGRTATGTGFLALKDGLAVTALHQVRNAKSVTARFSNGEEFECVGLVDADERRNVALLRIRLFGRPVLALTALEPVAASKVWFASARSEGFGVAEATMQAPIVEGGVKYLPFTSSISPETSGGPLLNAAGEVLGVVAIRTVEGREQCLALPSASVLALDPTLATRPWSGAAGSPKPSGQADETVDRTLADGLVNCLSLATAYTYADLRTGGVGYLEGIPLVLYQVRQAAETSSSAVAAANSVDPLRQRLLQKTRKVHEGLLKSTDLMIQSVVLAQQQGAWGAASKDLWSRSKALVEETTAADPELQADARQLFATSEAFRAALPAEGAIRLGLVPHTSGYALGVDSLPRDPFALLMVLPDSFAARLGFKPGDRVVSVAGREFNATETTEDLKLLLKAHLGEKIPAVVERGGERETMTLRLPKEIPPDFLATP